MSNPDLSSSNNNFDTWSNNLQSIILDHQNKSGIQYLDAVLADLARILQAEHVFVGVTTDASNTSVKTISYCAHQKIAPNFEYSLACTPCADVLGRDICSFTSNLASKFPDDQIIVDLGIKSYIGVPLFDIDGQSLGVVVACYCREVQDTKLAQLLITLVSHKVSSEIYQIQSKTTLMDSQLQFQQLFDNSNDALMIQDFSEVLKSMKQHQQPKIGVLENDDRVLLELISKVITLETNHTFLNMFEIENKDKLNIELNNILINDFKNLYKSIFIKADNQILRGTISLSLHTSNDCYKTIEARWVIPLQYQDTWQKVFLSITDTTRKSELEQQLRQSEKMRAIGQLAGGIAHDFNNMLAGIIGSTDLLMLKKQHFDAQSQHFLELILDASERASDLTSRLLSFARKSNVTISPVDLHQTIHSTVSLIQSTISSQIELIVNLEAQNFIVSGDQSKLQSAIMNFLINSSQAIKGAGKITIKTRNTFFDEDYCKQSSYEMTPDPYISISISDTGCGIAPENIDKIFEPFYTTKEVGKGTGLGLSATFGTIQDHGGSIYTNSKLNKGTEFRVFLPADVQDNISSLDDNLVKIGRGQMILLADDEEIIRFTTKETLVSMGYKVLIADNGVQAVDLYKEQQDKISMVILDLNMPQMNGAEAFKKIIAMDHRAKVIISSGLIDNNLLQELIHVGLLGAIHKPFRIHELSQTLSKFLV